MVLVNPLPRMFNLCIRGGFHTFTPKYHRLRSSFLDNGHSTVRFRMTVRYSHGNDVEDDSDPSVHIFRDPAQRDGGPLFPSFLRQ